MKMSIITSQICLNFHFLIVIWSKDFCDSKCLEIYAIQILDSYICKTLFNFVISKPEFFSVFVILLNVTKTSTT